MRNAYVRAAESNHAWQATIAGRYDDALPTLNALLDEEGNDRVDLTRRGIIGLLTNDLQGALADFMAVRNIPPPPSVINEYVGTALWLMGKQEDACQDWANEIARLHAGQITHCLETGKAPPLLWWASAHPEHRHWRKLAEEALKRRWRTKMCQRSQWPGSIVGFLLGQRSEQDLLAAVPPPGHLLQPRDLCQARFYIAAVYLDRGDQQRYQIQLASAVGLREGTPTVDDRVGIAEYHLALADLRSTSKS